MSKPSNTLHYWMELSDNRIQDFVNTHLPDPETTPKRFNQALTYVMKNGGKRIRPTLVYLTAHVLGSTLEECDPPALAVELIHTYSLIHDDLPAMDNDDIRRGQPACHKAFDEPTAILAADALHTFAFETLASYPSPLNSDQRLKMLTLLAQASGMHGMCKGQALDMESHGKKLSLSELTELHQCKTGALIRASILMGAATQPHLTKTEHEILEQFANDIGLAFQVQDDILDIIGTTETLGKPQGSDTKHGKITFPSVIGMDDAKRLAKDLCAKSKEYLTSLKYNCQPLCNLADYIINRAA